MKKANLKKGFSLIEMLVVVVVFSILAIITTQSLLNSLRTAKKSQNVNVVKENLEVSASAIERLLRNAEDVRCENNSGSPSNREIYYMDNSQNQGREIFLRCLIICQ